MKPILIDKLVKKKASPKVPYKRVSSKKIFEELMQKEKSDVQQAVKTDSLNKGKKVSESKQVLEESKISATSSQDSITI